MKKSKKILLISGILLLLFTGQKGLLLSQSTTNNPANNKEYNVSSLEWKLWGYRPESWKMDFNFNELKGPRAEYINVKAKVPGSVQKALRDAGIIGDWNIGNNYIGIEWIENRHWIFTTRLPEEWITKESKIILRCLGLDDNGVIMVNGKEAGKFNNTFIPYNFDITPFLKDKNNTLAIVFECPPSYLGQIGYTSKITDWKPRYYYGWDWIPRIVQIGIWDNILLEVLDKESARIEEIKVITEADKNKDFGNLKISAELSSLALRGKVRIQLSNETGDPIVDETVPATKLREGKAWDNLKIKRWWPNGSGDQVLYQLVCTLYDVDGNNRQVIERNVGFKNIEWLSCQGALPEADPWSDSCIGCEDTNFVTGIMIAP